VVPTTPSALEHLVFSKADEGVGTTGRHHRLCLGGLEDAAFVEVDLAAGGGGGVGVVGDHDDGFVEVALKPFEQLPRTNSRTHPVLRLQFAAEVPPGIGWCGV